MSNEPTPEQTSDDRAADVARWNMQAPKPPHEPDVTTFINAEGITLGQHKEAEAKAIAKEFADAELTAQAELEEAARGYAEIEPEDSKALMQLLYVSGPINVLELIVDTLVLKADFERKRKLLVESTRSLACANIVKDILPAIIQAESLNTTT